MARRLKYLPASKPKALEPVPEGRSGSFAVSYLKLLVARLAQPASTIAKSRCCFAFGPENKHVAMRCRRRRSSVKTTKLTSRPLRGSGHPQCTAEHRMFDGWICITFSIVMPSLAIHGVVLLADFLPPSRPVLKAASLNKQSIREVVLYYWSDWLPSVMIVHRRTSTPPQTTSPQHYRQTPSRAAAPPAQLRRQ